MRAASLAIAAEEYGIRSFQKNDLSCDHAPNRFHDRGEVFELFFFANVHHQRGNVNLPRPACEFGKTRNQTNRQVVHTVIAEVFKCLEDGSLPGATHACDDDQFAVGAVVTRIRFLVGELLGDGSELGSNPTKGHAEEMLAAE